MTTEKVVRPVTRSLFHEEVLQFQKGNLVIFDKYNDSIPKLVSQISGDLGIGEFLPEFRTQIQSLDDAVEVIKKSDLTAKIEAADTRCDHIFAGLRDYTKASLNHFDEAVQDAAHLAWIVFEHYGNIAEHPYDREISEIFNLIEELESRTNAYALLQLAPWCNSLKDATLDFQTILANRDEETGSRTAAKAKEVRNDLDAVYQAIVNRLDAMINLHGKDYVPGFLGEYNAHAKRFKDLLAQRKGKAKKTIKE